MYLTNQVFTDTLLGVHRLEHTYAREVTPSENQNKNKNKILKVPSRKNTYLVEKKCYNTNGIIKIAKLVN